MNFKQRFLFLLAICQIVSLSLSAVPAKKGIITVEQPDGTQLDIRLYGDEHYAYATTEDGFLVVDNENGWEYAKYEGDNIVSLNVLAKNSNVRTGKELTSLAKIGRFEMSDKEFLANRAKSRLKSSSEKTVQQRIGVRSEVKNGLVILVNFSDKKFSSATANQDFHNLLNEKGYNKRGSIGSAKDYFNDMSYGAYDPNFEVFGPYTLDNNMAYYGGKTADAHDANAPQMVVDAMAKLMEDKGDEIDLSIFDQDDDGVIDNVFIYFAGNNQAEGGNSNTIWPHKYEVGAWNSTGTFTYQNKKIKVYACTSEMRGATASGGMCGIGTFCHEFTHVLGLPDVYDTEYSGHKTSGTWDLMDQGSYNGNGHVPPSYSAYERFFMKWVKPTLLKDAGHYTLKNINDNDSAAYVISSTGIHNMDAENPNPIDYHVLETRVQEGWDKYVKESGLIITRIRYNKYAWIQNRPNNDPNLMRIDIIESSVDNDADAFPYNPHLPTGITEYTPYVNYPITMIEYKDKQSSFYFIGKNSTVHFDAGKYGTVDIDSLVEETPDGGVLLPDVVANDTCVFEGWSTYMTAHIANAGKAGETYNPKDDMTLYAVYSANGEIIVDMSCLIETFDKAVGEADEDLSRYIDDYTDVKGWIAAPIYAENGAMTFGSDSKNGSLTSPELKLNGNATIKISAKASKRTSLNVEVIGAGMISDPSIEVSTRFKDFELLLVGCDFDTKLKFIANTNIFSIDNIEICYTQATATDNVFTKEVMIVDNSYVAGLQAGDVVSCIDINGRMLWTQTAESDTLDFEAPNGLYLIRVVRGNNIINVKGLK